MLGRSDCKHRHSAQGLALHAADLLSSSEKRDVRLHAISGNRSPRSPQRSLHGHAEEYCKPPQLSHRGQMISELLKAVLS